MNTDSIMVEKLCRGDEMLLIPVRLSLLVYRTVLSISRDSKLYSKNSIKRDRIFEAIRNSIKRDRVLDRCVVWNWSDHLLCFSCRRVEDVNILAGELRAVCSIFDS